jgi:hypothetical protein
LGKKQRDALWPVFARLIDGIASRGLETEASVFWAVATHFDSRTDKPFDHIVVDEAQDLGVPALRFLAAIAPATHDALFFAGDLGQRIFQQPFSWKALGVNVHGRSTTLKVNYRTSHQIREAADRLLTTTVSDVDGREEDREGTVSVFNGPIPLVLLAENAAAEGKAIGAFISRCLAEGIAPEEIGVFVRTRDVLGRARDAVAVGGAVPSEIILFKGPAAGAVRVGVMHLAKGLEWRRVDPGRRTHPRRRVRASGTRPRPYSGRADHAARHGATDADARLAVTRSARALARPDAVGRQDGQGGAGRGPFRNGGPRPRRIR